jgi:thiol-disulfide isomerase/thioredoxin
MSSRSLVLAIALAAACHKGPKLPEGDVATTLTATALDAHPFDAASFHGKPSLVLFVSPTCPYCLATIPRAAAAAKSEGANAVLVFVVGHAKNAVPIVEHAKWAGPALVDEDGALKKLYAVKSVPYTLVLGADGRARDALEGEQEESDLREALVAAK